jgi:hypothetical protein
MLVKLLMSIVLETVIACFVFCSDWPPCAKLSGPAKLKLTTPQVRTQIPNLVRWIERHGLHLFHEFPIILLPHIIPHDNMASRSVSPLLRLPNEILYMIAEEFCSPADIVKLLVCNRQLKDNLTWSLLRQNVKSYGATLVPWAAFNGQLETLKTLHSMDDTLVTRRWGTDQTDDNDVRGVSPPSNPQFAQLRQLPHTRGEAQVNGISALHAAVAAGHDHIISWLLDNGSDINSKYQRLCRCVMGGFDDDWRTPLYLALCQRRDSSARLLIQRGASVGMISAFAPITESSSATSLGSSPAPPSVSSPESSTAASPGYCPAESDYVGTTALHVALATGSIELVRFLLDSKLVHPDVTTQAKMTARRAKMTVSRSFVAVRYMG